MTDYVALIGCENDKERYEPGDMVPGEAFSANVVKHWIKKGVLAKAAPSKKQQKTKVRGAN